MGISPLAARSFIPGAGLSRIVLPAVAAAVYLGSVALPQDEFGDLDIDTLDREVERETVEQDKNSAAQALIAQAEKQASGGQFEQAINTYRAFLKGFLTHGKSAEVTKRIAELESKLALKTKEDGLREALRKSAADPAKQVEAWLTLAEFHVSQKQDDAVESLCRDFLSRRVVTRQELDAPLRLAALLAEAGRPKLALEAYEAAFASYPERLESYYETLLSTKTGNPDQMGRVRREPADSQHQRQALAKIAALYAQLGDKRGAASARTRLMASLPEPETEYCRYLLEAERESAEGNFAGACALYLASLELPPADHGLHRRTECHSVAKRTNSPVPHRSPREERIGNPRYDHDDASGKDPGSASAPGSAERHKPQPLWQLELIFRGLWACGQGLSSNYDDQRLRSVLSECYPALAKELEIAGAGKGPALAATGDGAGTQNASKSTGPLILARMWEMASRHAQRSEWEEAEKVYDDLGTAMAGSFFEPLTLYWLGASASRQGQYAHAVRRFGLALERADALRLQSCGLRHRCLYGRGLAQLRWERYSLAEGSFSEFLSTPTVSPLLLSLTLYRLGQCYESQGNSGKALETYRALLELECTGLKLEHTVRAAIDRIEGQ